MSLIIKGMSLPLPGDVMVCALIDDKLQCSIVTRGKPIEWCEALEIPTPHGRLIDVDKLKCPLSWQGEIVRATVREAPTIIEAEVSE